MASEYSSLGSRTGLCGRRVRSAPEFLNGPSREAMSWRIPLVSSFLVSTGYLVLMHYLSASLQ